MAASVLQVTIHRLAIPMKVKFAHAASTRAVAEPIIVEIELTDGTIGYGETHPRDYVTGETVGSVPADIEGPLLDPLMRVMPSSFAGALEAASELPFSDAAGRCISAARAGVELALLDAYSRYFGRAIDDAAGWLGLARFGTPGSVGAIRYSGMLWGNDPSRLVTSFRKQRLFGLRDFKLKVGMASDGEVVPAVVRAMGRKLRAGRLTLRVDANAGWSYEQAVERLIAWRDFPIASVEQPISLGQPERLAQLSRTVPQPIMVDESLVTYEQGEELARLGAANLFNIRLSKNGGLLPAIHLASLARQHGLGYQLGCMVGETSILSAAGWQFLRLVPGVRFAEGAYGRFLLRDDVVARPVRFGFGGKLRMRGGLGWGVQVRPEKLAALACDKPMVIRL